MRSIQGLLYSIGCSRRRVYALQMDRNPKICRKSFWKRPDSELLGLLEESRTRYRDLIKKIHPDRKGSNMEASELNCTWARIKVLFAKRNLTLP